MTVRLAMWSGPRNLSTAMMRSWENRSDTVVMDEPLYGAYLAATGLVHPMRQEILAALPTASAQAIDACLAPFPAGVQVCYQKHMAHHLLDEMPREWLDELTNVLLLRDPRRVLASYVKKRETVTLADIGLPQQLELFERFTTPLIIDSADFLTNPEAYCRYLCRYIEVPFESSMLSWRTGPRPTDGVWAPAWYDAVWASTGFGPPATDTPLPKLEGAAADVVDDAMDIYAQLSKHRLAL